jgi:acyl carrier protein
MKNALAYLQTQQSLPHPMKLTTEEIRRTIIDLVAELLGLTDDQILDSATFDDLGADSLDRVELIMMIEEEFVIDIPDADAETINTVAEAVAYLERVLA